MENTVQEQTTTSRPFVTPSSVPEVPNEEEGDDDTVEAWLTPGPPVGMDTSSTTPESSNQYDIGPPIVALNPENPYVPTNSNPLSYPVVSQEELAFTSLMCVSFLWLCLSFLTSIVLSPKVSSYGRSYYQTTIVIVNGYWYVCLWLSVVSVMRILICILENEYFSALSYFQCVLLSS